MADIAILGRALRELNSAPARRIIGDKAERVERGRVIIIVAAAFGHNFGDGFLSTDPLAADSDGREAATERRREKRPSSSRH